MAVLRGLAKKARDASTAAARSGGRGQEVVHQELQAPLALVLVHLQAVDQMLKTPSKLGSGKACPHGPPSRSAWAVSSAISS